MTTIDDYVTDVLMRDLVGHDRRPVAFLVYLWLAAAQAKSGRAVEVSFLEMAERVGVSKSSAQAAVRWLARRKLLAVTKANATAIPSYKTMTPWKDGMKKDGAKRGR